MVALNKRSKEAESAFLGIYKQLIEAPGEFPTNTRDVHLHKQQQPISTLTHTSPRMIVLSSYVAREESLDQASACTVITDTPCIHEATCAP